MKVEDLLEAKRTEILKIAAEHGASNVRLFGSAARGEIGPDSDIDMLVELEPGLSLLDFIGLKLALEDLLACKVDLATERSLHRRIKKRVLKEAVPL